MSVSTPPLTLPGPAFPRAEKSVRARQWIAVVLGGLMAMQGVPALCQEEPPKAAPVLGALSQLRWEYRVLLVVANRPSDRETVLLREQDAELRDRDTLWFVFQDGDVLSNYPGPLADGFGERGLIYLAQGHRVVLIGKDGGVKLRARSLDLKAVFGLIDGMPMRRREIEQRKGGGPR